MKQSTITVGLEQGLEARPIAMFVQIASKYASSVYVELADKKVNAKSIMGMMSLSLQKGEKLNVVVDGDDESEALCEVEKFLSGNGEV